MEIEEYKRRIIEKIKQMDESDMKFLCQILTLLRMYEKETGRK